MSSVRKNPRTSELHKETKTIGEFSPLLDQSQCLPSSSPNLSVSKPNNLAGRPLVLTDNRLLGGRKPRAHRHLQRRHDERELAANFEETPCSQPYTKTTWWARACRKFRGNHVLSQPYTKTTWWARACSKFWGNHALTAINIDDMMSASLPQIIMWTNKKLLCEPNVVPEFKAEP